MNSTPVTRVLLLLATVFAAWALSVLVFHARWGHYPDAGGLVIQPLITFPISLPMSASASVQWFLGGGQGLVKLVSVAVAVLFWPCCAAFGFFAVREGHRSYFIAFAIVLVPLASHWHIMAIALMGI